MGCSVNKEALESEILLLQLQKAKIKDERKKMLEKYKNLTGENLKRPKIPDYILDKKITKIKIKKNKSIKINQESSISTKSNSNKIFFTES